jgi:hypothetical protein
LEFSQLVLLSLVGRGDHVIGSALPVMVALIASIIITVALVTSPITKSGFGSFFCCDHLLDYRCEFLMSLGISPTEILELALVPDSHGKIIYDFMICDFIDLRT